MNEKLNHCVSLIELLSSHLSNKHSTKLEWTIIILIMVEVFFETIHYVDRYVSYLTLSWYYYFFFFGIIYYYVNFLGRKGRNQ